MSSLNVLGNIRVASPCPEDWDGMTGDSRTRHCDRCDRNVFNLSGMTREEAEALILSAEGRLCVRFYQRPDGTVMTRDCGVAVFRRRRRMVWVGGAIAAVLSLVTGGVLASQRKQCATSGGSTSLLQMQPFSTLSAWFPNVFPQPPVQPLMGEMVYIPPPNNNSGSTSSTTGSGNTP